MGSRSTGEIRTVFAATDRLLRSLSRASAASLVCGALLVVPTAGATAQPRSYAHEAAVADSIASHGITYAGVHKDIAGGRCHGLARFGVKRIGLLNAYHRLYCNLTGRDRQVYEAQVLIVRSSSTGFSWRILSGKRRL